jgi:two-component system cell cycle sensor histidine kinase/response regulator CckA
MAWSLHEIEQFLDVLPDAALVIRGHDHVVAANSLAAELFGCAPAQLFQIPLGSLLAEPPEAANEQRPVRAEGPGTPIVPVAEAILLRGDGRRVPVEVSRRPMDMAGESFVVAVVRETTDRKRAQDELKTSEERLRQAVRVSEIGIFDHDHGTDIHYWSARQREIYGWPEDEPITVPTFLERLHPGDRNAIAAGIQRAHGPDGDGSFDVEHRIIRSDGEVRWISTRSITLFAGEGAARRPVRTVGASVDFTDRKQGEEGRERLAATLDATPDFVAIGDPLGRLLYANRAARALLGVDPGESISNARVSEHRPEWATLRVVETAMPTAIREGVWVGETAFLNLQGQEIPFSQVMLAHRGSDGDVAFVSTIARDISKEKELEAQVLQAQKMEAIGRLAGGVAHDFNNLLSVILNAAALAHRAVPPGHPSREALDNVTSAGERAAELTRRMLAFSRKQVLRPQIVDVNEVLRGMTPMLRHLISEQIDQITLLEPDLGLVRADPSQLEQVILNLVVNARDAMPDGGKLTIETGHAPAGERSDPSRPEPTPYVTISVSDTGVGMDAATKARLFEPYFTTKPVGQGTGLGLSVVFGIVKQSGGDIGVESEPGRGTTFKVYFPLVADGARPHAPRSAHRAPRPDSAIVLLVEDEGQLRRLVANVLGKSGYRVLEAAGPKEALALARDHAAPIDLLLTDVVMPHMSGKALADRLTAERPGIRVLYTTGYAESTIVEQGVLQGDVHLLPKPFTLDELLTTVRTVIAGTGHRLE